ncbi:hypothetical protein [Legionella norrlandica]|uniref:hypothetical protein n=1 Tax=Legionella norrlandica TaxID=1498499 RepID=UPI00056B406C|nr:hypothetical protein [Legionella norrlandica]
MKKDFFLSLLYAARHLMALFIMLTGLYLIKIVTVLLYLTPQYQTLPLLSVAHVLWLSGDVFLRFIVIINFIVKPLFLYFGTLFLLYCLGP